jgi:hypothetical protein
MEADELVIIQEVVPPIATRKPSHEGRIDVSKLPKDRSVIEALKG